MIIQESKAWRTKLIQKLPALFVLFVMATFLFGGFVLLSQLKPTPQFPEYVASGLSELNLRISPEDLRKIERKRAEALRKEVLVTGDEDLIPALLEYDGQQLPAKIRLKGDWTDHLEGSKWSFRVEMDDGYAWNRLVTFSLQSPARRDFLNEWFYHQWLERENVLTTRYDFIGLKLNGKSLGLYVFEEHFDKQLLESRSRREGPIIKLAEDGYWNYRLELLNGRYMLIDEKVAVHSAPIQPFHPQKTLKSPTLAANFYEAQALLHQFRIDAAAPSTIFDADQYGKYLALTDLTRTYHGTAWNNMRFYYNPLTAKLEPIGYDGDTEGGLRKWIQYDLMANDPRTQAIPFVGKPLRDSLIRQAYFRSLESYASEAYQDTLFGEMDEALSRLELLIQKENPDYQFDKAAFLENAANIRQQN